MGDYAYGNLTKPRNTATGLTEIAYYAAISEFTTIRTPQLAVSPNPTVPGEQVTIAANHSFPSGKGFKSLLAPPNKNMASATGSGDPGNMKLIAKAELFIAGSYATLHETIKNMMNEPIIFLVKEFDTSGYFRQIGTAEHPAYFTAIEETTDNVKGAYKGYKITVESAAPCVYIYTGTLTRDTSDSL